MVKSGGKVLLVAFYHGPVTADVSHAVRRNVTIYTERGEGGTSVGRALALLAAGRLRSEEHTSELQSRLHLVCRLLLEKKKISREHGMSDVKGLHCGVCKA